MSWSRAPGEVGEHRPELQPQPLLAREDRQPAGELVAVVAARHARTLLERQRRHVGQRRRGRGGAELGDELRPVRSGRPAATQHRPVREQPLERVAEHRDQPGVGVVVVHPLEGVRPEQVRRRGVAGDQVLGLAAGGAVAGVVGPRPVHVLAGEELELLARGAGHLRMPVEGGRQGRGAALLRADDREAVGQPVVGVTRAVGTATAVLAGVPGHVSSPCSIDGESTKHRARAGPVA